jgi:hypothetical protein
MADNGVTFFNGKGSRHVGQAAHDVFMASPLAAPMEASNLSRLIGGSGVDRQYRYWYPPSCL